MTDLAAISDADLLASLPRGVRNNNPLNVEDGAFARSHPGYKGGDGRFAVFETMDDGLAAADHNLQGYHQRHGLNTVAGVVNRWAPPKENDTGAYANFVAGKLGVDPDHPLDMEDPAVRRSMLSAMAEHENGVPVTAPAASDLSHVSDADLMASLGHAAPAIEGEHRVVKDEPAPKAAAPRAIPMRSGASWMPGQFHGPDEVLRALKDEAAKAGAWLSDAGPRGGGGDAARGGVSGIEKGLAALGDTAISASPVGQLHNYLKGVGNLSALFTGDGKVSAGGIPGAYQPLSAVAAKNGYKPQSIWGRLAEAAGTMLPNAAIPASLPVRAASVALPAAGQVGGEALAKAAGADEAGQKIAGAAGAGLGGLASGARLPMVSRLPKGDLAALDAAQNAAWAKVDASTYRFAKADSQAAAKDIRTLVDEAGPELHENSAKYAAKIQAMAQRGDLTLGQLNRLKSQMGAKLMSGDEAGLARPMLDRVEALINTAKDPTLREAREAYKRFMKVKEVTERLDSADLAKTTSGTGGNSNAPAQKLRPLIDPKSNQRIKNLTPEETEALNKVVRGDFFEKALRLGSTFDPTAGKLRMGAFGFGASANPALAIPIAAGGYLAGRGKDAIQAKNVQALIDLMAAGGTRPIPMKAPLPAYAFAPAVTAPMLATPAIASPPSRKTSRR